MPTKFKTLRFLLRLRLQTVSINKGALEARVSESQIGLKFLDAISSCIPVIKYLYHSLPQNVAVVVNTFIPLTSIVKSLNDNNHRLSTSIAYCDECNKWNKGLPILSENTYNKRTELLSLLCVEFG